MIKIVPALMKDAHTLLQIQKDAFKIYSDKYGDFESNPYHMTLHRMEFNLHYRFGKYYKIVDDTLPKEENIIGGIFAFELDDPKIVKISQFYLKKDYQCQGYGKRALSEFMALFPNVTTWYVDTIYEEEYNVEFYKKLGFTQVDLEEEHEGLIFITLMKKEESK
jgi:RimJ/RimL family protein N-acetyltransferase